MSNIQHIGMKQHLLYNKPASGGGYNPPLTPDILHIYADNPENQIDSNNKVISIANVCGPNSTDVANSGAVRLDLVENKLNGLPAFKSYYGGIAKIANVFGDGSLFQNNDFTLITLI